MNHDRGKYGYISFVEGRHDFQNDTLKIPKIDNNNLVQIILRQKRQLQVIADLTGEDLMRVNYRRRKKNVTKENISKVKRKIKYNVQ